MDAETAIKHWLALPPTWHPRREQPSWDRDFTGRQDMLTQFQNRTDKAMSHMVVAVAFSDVIKGGYSDDPDGLKKVGRDTRAIVKQHASKNGK